MAVQVLDENGIVRTLPEVSEVGARIDEKVQANMPEDGADGKDGLSIWETTTNTTTGTTSISISTLNTVEGRSVQVGDYIIGNATYSYLYLVTAVNSTTVTVTYRRTLRGATGSGGSVTVDTALSSTSENPVQNKVINAALKDGSVTKIGNALKVGTETYDGSAAVNAGRRSWYGTCETDEAISAKVVSDCTGFVLETGAKVSIKFKYANSTSAPKLNVNGTGEKFIRISNSYAGTLAYHWYAYQVVDFVYDGTYWILQQPWFASTTYYGLSKVESLSLNGSLNATPSFYAPTSAGTKGQFIRWSSNGYPNWAAIGIGSTISSALTGQTATEVAGNGYIRMRFDTTYDLLICFGAFTSTTSAITFPQAFSQVPFVMTSPNPDGDTQTQRVAVKSVTKTGFTTQNSGSYSGRYIAIGFIAIAAG